MSVTSATTLPKTFATTLPVTSEIKVEWNRLNFVGVVLFES